jgi:molybdopterin-guanine dinucleotide biosynthesis protein MobB
MQVIALVGSKKSGKTTTLENLIKELTERGYKVAAIKHIAEPDFTIDTAGKDTWKFAKAGAKTIVSMAANEIATIEKGTTESLSLEKLLKKCRGNDIVLIESFKKQVALKKNISKIVVTKSKKEATNALQTFKPILVFSGPYSTETLGFTAPYADGLRNPKKLADLIEKAILKK